MVRGGFVFFQKSKKRKKNEKKKKSPTVKYEENSAPWKKKWAIGEKKSLGKTEGKGERPRRGEKGKGEKDAPNDPKTPAGPHRFGEKRPYPRQEGEVFPRGDLGKEGLIKNRGKNRCSGKNPSAPSKQPKKKRIDCGGRNLSSKKKASPY